MHSPPKALVLVDGSDRSLMTVDYICRMPMFKPMKIVLYHVFTSVPESYWDLENEPSSIRAFHELRAWEKLKRGQIEEFMETARHRLTAAGFTNETIEIKIHNREKGIARDILKEADSGYAMVVLRRRGMGQLEGMSMGSVAAKILTRLTSLPIQVAGRKEWNHKILIGIDGSDSAAQAVDFVAQNLGNDECSIGLVHVIRGFANVSPDNFKLMISPQDVEGAAEKMNQHFFELKKKLAAAGVKPDNISEKIITGSYSRAGSLVAEAESGNYSTIAVGRRGHSKVQEFFMGRVCQKAVQAGRYHTVWII